MASATSAGREMDCQRPPQMEVDIYGCLKMPERGQSAAAVYILRCAEGWMLNLLGRWRGYRGSPPRSLISASGKARAGGLGLRRRAGSILYI